MTVKVFSYTAGTWLLANLIHPLVWLLVMVWKRDLDYSAGYLLTYFFDIVIFSAACSLPGCMVAALVLRIILSRGRSVRATFLIWMLAVPFMMFMNIIAGMFLFDFWAFQLLTGFLPGMIAAVFAIRLRRRQFNVLAAQFSLRAADALGSNASHSFNRFYEK